MLIAGASGHAVETLNLLEQMGYSDKICFYDDVTEGVPATLLGLYPVLRTIVEAREWLKRNPKFCLGVGNPKARKILFDKLTAAGGKVTTLLAPNAVIGKHEVTLGDGVAIMSGAIVTERIAIGHGSLVHVHASVHHDVRVGEYCELSPGCRLLGNVDVGDFTSIGSGAIVLPHVTIGRDVVVGAGAVVTCDVRDGVIVKGVPAK